jgi:sec-independent protein translocase protein TatB
MLDFSFSELALVALVALLVVDPKDVPGMMRSCMKWFGELRSVTDEVKVTVKSLMDEAQMTQLKDEIEGDLNEMRALPKHQKYIEDDQGRLQPVYDISDFIKPDEKPGVISEVKLGEPKK